MTMPSIDLNCDMGELDSLADTDAELLRVITSANIACGGHAGDDASMRRTVLACKAAGVAVGAHPSYLDREGFGRQASPLSPADLLPHLIRQIDSLQRIARSLDVPISHIKPHGALYHAAMSRPEIALAISTAAQHCIPGVTLVGLAGAHGLEVWRAAGHPVSAEAFADRRYEPGGSLRARALPGALLESPRLAAQQALDIAVHRRAACEDGTFVPVLAQTICLHSDTPGAVTLARAVRDALAAAGVQIAAPEKPASA